jgi:hypothetical protein
MITQLSLINNVYRLRPKKGNAKGTNPPTGPVKGFHPKPDPNPLTPPTGTPPNPDKEE